MTDIQMRNINAFMLSVCGVKINESIEDTENFNVIDDRLYPNVELSLLVTRSKGLSTKMNWENHYILLDIETNKKQVFKTLNEAGKSLGVKKQAVHSALLSNRLIKKRYKIFKIID